MDRHRKRMKALLFRVRNFLLGGHLRTSEDTGLSLKSDLELSLICGATRFDCELQDRLVDGAFVHF